MFSHFVYIIKGVNSNNKFFPPLARAPPTGGKYYIGYTSNPQKRIKQHNREISGGAKATRGYKWSYCAIFANCRSKIEGLQIEWRLKYSTKKTHIVHRFNFFFKYIDTHLKASPNNIKMKSKLLLYINRELLPLNQILNQPINVIIINTIFVDEIINHICSK